MHAVMHAPLCPQLSGGRLRGVCSLFLRLTMKHDNPHHRSESFVLFLSGIAESIKQISKQEARNRFEQGILYLVDMCAPSKAASPGAELMAEVTPSIPDSCCQFRCSLKHRGIPFAALRPQGSRSLIIPAEACAAAAAATVRSGRQRECDG